MPRLKERPLLFCPCKNSPDLWENLLFGGQKTALLAFLGKSGSNPEAKCGFLGEKLWESLFSVGLFKPKHTLKSWMVLEIASFTLWEVRSALDRGKEQAAAQLRLPVKLSKDL